LKQVPVRLRDAHCTGEYTQDRSIHMNSYQIIMSLFHPGSLGEVRTWLCVATFAASGAAGWYLLEPLQAIIRKLEEH
jgi:hypothetical protein